MFACVNMCVSVKMFRFNIVRLWVNICTDGVFREQIHKYALHHAELKNNYSYFKILNWSALVYEFPYAGSIIISSNIFFFCHFNLTSMIHKILKFLVFKFFLLFKQVNILQLIDKTS